MSSGNKELNVNNLERAVSVDINRLQKFRNKDTAEFFKFMMDWGMNTDDLDASGVLTQNTTQNAPLSMEIVGGLTVKPDVGTLNLFVDPGLCYALNPDAAPDDSNYKFVNDPGIVGAGSLVMTGNSSGQTRIDVIEVQNGVNANAETDNRDVFNPSTGTFVATSVSKAAQGQLTYRVRQGSPGAGMPANQAGWTPLAVASVPTGTTTNDTITFWDVRPMVSDRIFAPFNLSTTKPYKGNDGFLVADDVTFAGKCVLTGEVTTQANDVVNNAGALYRLGGRLRRGTPGADLQNTGAFPDGVNLNDSANWNVASFSGANQPLYVYLAEPFGLPRWARYTDASTGTRKPRSCRGILIVSTQMTAHYNSAPAAAIALPASTGLGGTTSKAACIFVTSAASTTTVYGGSVQPNGQNFNEGGAFQTAFSPQTVTWTGGSNSASPANFALTDGVTHPPNAKALYFRVQAVGLSVIQNSLSFIGNCEFRCFVNSMAGSFPAHTQQLKSVDAISNPSTSATNTLYTAEWYIRVPLIPNYPSTANPSNRQIQFNFTAQNNAGAANGPNTGTFAVNLLLMGWDLW